MAISIQHASRSISKEQKQTSVTLTWQGTKLELEAYLATLTIGTWYNGLGQLTSYTLSQNEGPIWNLQLDYVVKYTDTGEIANDDEAQEISGPNTQTLQARLLSMPLETNPNYRTNWNHFLIGRYDKQTGTNYATVVPTWWATATDPYLDLTTADGQNYRWVRSLSETPYPTENEAWWMVKDAVTACKPLKPGVESYDRVFYTVTEVGEHKSKAQAGWVTNALVNTVVSSPLLGDFGLTPQGFNWKVDDISVQFDGKLWKATRSYTRSGDANGWDPDLYAYSSSSSATP